MMKHMAFVHEKVRAQREGGKHQKGSIIENEFGLDAMTIFEPFLRAYIPKLFNETPTINNLEVFQDIYCRRIQKLELLPMDIAQKFFGLGKGNKKEAKSLFKLYETHALKYCEIIVKELSNPSFNGFGQYIKGPILTNYSNGINFSNGLNAKFELENLPHSKIGPFGLFFAGIEKTFGISLGGEEENVNYFMDIFINSNALENFPPQQITLIFGLLFQFNLEFKKPDQKELCAFMNWNTLDTFRVHLSPYFLSTIYLMIIHQCSAVV
jgi:hypothetical protein